MSLQHQNRDHTFPFLPPAGTARTHAAAGQHWGEGVTVVQPRVGSSLQDEEWADCFLYCCINARPTCHIS
jgi:hypothetical protein